MSNNIYNFTNIPSMPEKVLSALAYLTLGFFGIIFIVASSLMKVNLKPFVRFNAYQSILLGFIFATVQLAYNIIDGILQFFKIIPVLGKFLYSLFQFITYYLLGFPVFLGFSLLAIALILVILYLTVSTIMGRKPYIPYISDVIQRTM